MTEYNNDSPARYITYLDEGGVTINRRRTIRMAIKFIFVILGLFDVNINKDMFYVG